MNAIQVKARPFRWNRLRFVAVCLLGSIQMEICGASAGDNAPGTEVRELLESHPSESTKKRIEELFESSSDITIMHTPESEMGRLGFNKDMAEQRASYRLNAVCRGNCAIAYSRLVGVLSTGLKQKGSCPSPVSTVFKLKNATDGTFVRMFATSGGQCFDLLDQAYFVPTGDLSKILETLRLAAR